jgi:4-hydroxy-tetrahydrodipicolinate synthase
VARRQAAAAAIAEGKATLQESRLITAVKTPYLANGRIDIPAYDAHMERQIEFGVQGVIVGGTTGEGQLMSWDEHVMLIAHTVNGFGDRLQVIGNTGSNSTREALHASEQGFIVGMHAALHINPYYGRTSIAGLEQHFQMCLAEGPSMLYNVPGRTGQDVPDAVVLALKDHPNFLGIKECTGNARIANYAANGVRCWSGNDDEAHDARHTHGGHGVVSVTSNLIPALYSTMMTTPSAELNQQLQDLISWMFSQPNPICINTAMAMCGLAKPVFRLPYVPLSRAEREVGAKLLDAVKQHIPGCTSVSVLEDSDFTVVSLF